MRKVLASLTIVVAALVLAAQPAGAKNDTKRTLAEIGAALEDHGITPCDERDWTKESYGDRDEPKGSATAVMRTRVVVANRPCPDRAAYADEIEWEDAADDYLIFAVYKSKSSKAYKKQAASTISDLFAYKRALILRPSADVLQEPFNAAMADLGARETG
jgi:hypothetical protein